MEDEMLLDSLEKQSKECFIKNRRKSSDFLLTLVNIFNYLVWGILLVIIAFCDNAGIKFFSMDNILIEELNLHFVNAAIKLSAILFIISFVLLMLSFKRCRRRTDKIKTSIFLGEIVSFIIWMLLVSKIYF